MMIRPEERGEKVVTFIDNGYSGGNMNRDGFQKMMGLVRQGKVSKVIVYKLAFRNTTEKELRFEADSFLAVAQNSGFHNGVSQENRKKNQTIQPGEVQEIELSCTVTEILIGKKWFQKLEEETYTLVYWWYPVQKELVFTNE